MSKVKYVFIGLVVFSALAYGQGVRVFDALNLTQWLKIGGTAPAHSTAALEINSTTKGFLGPRMSEAERDAINSPAQGLMIFNTDTNRLNIYDGSAWEEAGSGGTGEGGINFITNGQFEKNVEGWSTYADAAGAEPVDCTGGEADITFTRNTSFPLRGTGDAKLSKDDSDRQGQGVSIDFEVDNQDADGISTAMYVSFDYVTGSTYKSGDIKLFIKDLNGSIFPIRGPPGSDDGSLPASTSPTKYTGFFFTVPDHKKYRLCAHVATDSATDFDVWLDSVKVTPQGTAPGAIQTEWQSFTPTLNSLTNVNVRVGGWRRVGDTMEIQALIGYTGVGDASDFSITIPNGETIDTVKLNNFFSSNRNLGTVLWLDSGTSFKTGNVTVKSTTSLGLVMDGSTAFFQTNSTGNGDRLSLWFSVPIQGWAATQIVGTNEFLYQNPAKTPTKVTSSEKTPSASGHYHQLTNNALVLTRARTYELSGTAHFYNSGSTPGYGTVAAGWYGSNGADSSSPPTTALSSVVQIESAVVDGLSTYVDMSGGSNAVLQLPTVKVKCSSPPCTVYLVTYASINTATNSRIKVYANAAEIPDFSAWTAVPFIPPGTVSAYAGTNEPDGWLLCDGRAVSRSQYAALFAAIGTTHGHGDGSTTFNLPDYRGRFLRGVDGGVGRDPNRASRTAMATGGNTGDNVGSVQLDAFQSHAHERTRVFTNTPNPGVGTQTNIQAGTQWWVNADNSGAASGRTATETRPINAYVNFIIKY